MSVLITKMELAWTGHTVTTMEEAKRLVYKPNHISDFHCSQWAKERTNLRRIFMWAKMNKQTYFKDGPTKNTRDTYNKLLRDIEKYRVNYLNAVRFCTALNFCKAYNEINNK